MLLVRRFAARSASLPTAVAIRCVASGFKAYVELAVAQPIPELEGRSVPETLSILFDAFLEKPAQAQAEFAAKGARTGENAGLSSNAVPPAAIATEDVAEDPSVVDTNAGDATAGEQDFGAVQPRGVTAVSVFAKECVDALTNVTDNSVPMPRTMQLITIAEKWSVLSEDLVLKYTELASTCNSTSSPTGEVAVAATPADAVCEASPKKRSKKIAPSKKNLAKKKFVPKPKKPARAAGKTPPRAVAKAQGGKASKQPQQAPPKGKGKKPASKTSRK